MKIKNNHDVYEASNRLRDFVTRVSLEEIVTPVNLAAEKRAWCERLENEEISNPHFYYDRKLLKLCAYAEPHLRELELFFESAITPENLVEEALCKILDNRIQHAILNSQIANEMLVPHNGRAAYYIDEKYGRPGNKEQILAYELINKKDKLAMPDHELLNDEEREVFRRTEITSFDLIDLFQFALHFYGFTDWSCKTISGRDTVEVRLFASDKKLAKRIELPKGRHYNALEAIRRISHEIESHIRCIENSRNLFRHILDDSSPLLPLVDVLAKSDDESFYQGVARVNDVRICGFGALPDPCQITAIAQALRGNNFSEVASIIAKDKIDSDTDNRDLIFRSLFYHRHDIWKLAYRVFRGSTYSGSSVNNSSYAFTKDYACLSGYQQAVHDDSHYSDFASLTHEEITTLSLAGVDFGSVRLTRNEQLACYIRDHAPDGDILRIFKTSNS